MYVSVCRCCWGYLPHDTVAVQHEARVRAATDHLHVIVCVCVFVIRYAQKIKLNECARVCVCVCQLMKTL